MGVKVNASAIRVGDVIWDEAMVGDNHPNLVVDRDDWFLVMRNCTSHRNSALSLLEIKKGDKTGDPGWAGKDSYLVTNSEALQLNTMQIIGEDTVVQQQPEVAMAWQATPQGPVPVYVPTGRLLLFPVQVPRYGDLQYTRVGTVKAGRLAEILAELG